MTTGDQIYPASETRKELGGVDPPDKEKRAFKGEFRRSIACRGRGGLYSWYYHT